jgi:hypothetical protein
MKEEQALHLLKDIPKNKIFDLLKEVDTPEQLEAMAWYMRWLSKNDKEMFDALKFVV